METTVIEINSLKEINQTLEQQLAITMDSFRAEQAENKRLTKENEDLKFKLKFIKVLINKVD